MVMEYGSNSSYADIPNSSPASQQGVEFDPQNRQNISFRIGCIELDTKYIEHILKQWATQCLA